MTPLSGLLESTKINWFNYAHILETLSAAEQRVSGLIGINEGLLMKMAASSSKKVNELLDRYQRKISIHAR